MDQDNRPPLEAPNGTDRVLLHSCCAPCTGDVMDELRRSGIRYSVLFYNPNIHPVEEYERRKQENIRYACDHGVPFFDLDYDTDAWFERVKGLETLGERSPRCEACFDMRLERTALFAVENGFSAFTSALGISRWKDMNQVNRCGEKAAARWPGLVYWTHNWRKKGGAQRMVEVAKREHFYQQEYCGCVYSLRETNLGRKANGLAPIEPGIRYYGVE